MYSSRLTLAAVAAVAMLGTSAAQAELVRAKLSSYSEVPTIATLSSGSFFAVIDSAQTRIDYELRYEGLEGEVLQAHIHLGTAGTNGGIIVFLCTNLGNEPESVSDPAPLCPGPTSGKVRGTILPGDVIGPMDQGLNAGEFEKLLAALRNGGAYINVHSSAYTSGELRGQAR